MSSTLRKAGYAVRKQVFDFPFYQEVGPSTLKQTAPTDKSGESTTLEFSGDGGLNEDNSRMAARQAITVDQLDYRGSQLLR